MPQLLYSCHLNFWTYISVFSPNTGKHGPEITPCLDTFHAGTAMGNLLTEDGWSKFSKSFIVSCNTLWRKKFSSENISRNFLVLLTNNLHCVKSVQIRSYFWSVFSCILTEYGELLRIQFEYRKIRTRKNSVFGHFSRSVIVDLFDISIW